MAAPNWAQPEWTKQAALDYSQENELLASFAATALGHGFRVVPPEEQEPDLREAADLVLEREDHSRLLFSIREKSANEKMVIDVDARPRARHIEIRFVSRQGWVLVSDSRIELPSNLTNTGLDDLSRYLLDQRW